MSEVENARWIAFYNAARAEILQRLALREQMLIAYLTTSGVIVGIAFRSPGKPEYGLMATLPAVALLFSIALLRHDRVMGRLGDYIGKDLRRHLSSNRIVDWDKSETMRSTMRLQLPVESALYLLLFGVPAYCGLFAYLIKDPSCHFSPMGLGSLGAAFSLTILLLWRLCKAVANQFTSKNSME